MRLRPARTASPPDVPLEPGEFTEIVLRGKLTDPTEPGLFSAKAEKFVGRRVGTSRWILLTTRRLLVIAPFPREGDWFDVSFDRRTVSASQGVKRADIITIDVLTPRGRQVLRLPASSRTEAARLVRALRR